MGICKTLDVAGAWPLVESFVILIGAIVLLIWIISRLLGRSSSNNVSPSLSFRPSDRKQPTQSVPHPSLTNSPLSFDAAFDEAVTKKKRLWIEYRDLNADISQRNIEVYFPKDKTYVFAWCCLRNEPRTFRRDAILRWKVLDENFSDNPLVERYIRQESTTLSLENKVPWADWIASQARPLPGSFSGTAKTKARSEPNRLVLDKDSWVPPGETISVQTYCIRGGGIYVGSGLPSLSGLRKAEPALIDPGLKINSLRPDKTGSNIPYWPSYAELSPESRAGYLEWLVSSRRDADVHVGYPFLFFYGFERRVFGNNNPWSHPANELRFMQEELTVLLNTYGNIKSFFNYASSFSDILDTVLYKDILYTQSPPTESLGNQLPLSLQVVISQFTTRGAALPANWALSWVLCHPDTRLRTSGRRCVNELRELFHLRYQSEFGQGVKLKPVNRKLTYRYHPANPTFGGDLELTFPSAEIAGVPTIPKKLIDLLDRCIDELDPYSRWIANPLDAHSDILKFALLPTELVEKHKTAQSLPIRHWLSSQQKDQEIMPIISSQLLSQVMMKPGEKVSKAQGVMIAQLLEKLGYGIEPDVRFGGPVLQWDSKLMLFKSDNISDNTPSPEYSLATLLLHMGSIVAMADGVFGPDEETRLENQLETILHLKESERRRLRAHLQWLITDPPSFGGLAKRVESLNSAQKRSIGQFVISLAGADGQIDTAEIRALEKIYALLGFERDKLFSDLHGLSIPTDAEPCVVQKAEPAKNRYRIPKPTTVSQPSEFTLDMSKVNAKLAETASVSALLGSIFVTDDIEPPHVPKGNTVGALDARHSAFVLCLLQKESWARCEVEELAKKNGLMIEGALEKINDTAFDLGNQPICEGDDPIEINVSFAREMLK